MRWPRTKVPFALPRSSRKSSLAGLDDLRVLRADTCGWATTIWLSGVRPIEMTFDWSCSRLSSPMTVRCLRGALAAGGARRGWRVPGAAEAAGRPSPRRRRRGARPARGARAAPACAICASSATGTGTGPNATTPFGIDRASAGSAAICWPPTYVPLVDP